MDATPELSADRLNELYRARIAVSIAFFIIGVGLGLWAVHIPLVSARLNLDSAVLGFVLLVMAIGAVPAMPLTGALLGRFGSRLPTAGADLRLHRAVSAARFSPATSPSSSSAPSSSAPLPAAPT